LNNLLQLKGKFQKGQNLNSFDPVNWFREEVAATEHFIALIRQLQSILAYWKEHGSIGGALVSVHYKHAASRGSRLKVLLSVKGKSPDESIRGIRFVRDENNVVVTHYVPPDAIADSIQWLQISAQVMYEKYEGKITIEDTIKINGGEYKDDRVAGSIFLKVISDACSVDFFTIDCLREKIEDESMITFYRTDIDITALLNGFGIKKVNGRKIGETTVRLMPNEIGVIMKKAPYLIAAGVKDFSGAVGEDILWSDKGGKRGEAAVKFPKPQSEPLIGVLDTPFDESAYFCEWVEYENKLDPAYSIRNADFFHGTAVSSVIVDGPGLNPGLDDGCGRFRVRHFGISRAGGFSLFSFLKTVRDIVAENREIKVWNLSLGSPMGDGSYYVSPEAAELDRIQDEFDVIFVIAGADKGMQEHLGRGVLEGSLNALVVDTVRSQCKTASCDRGGPGVVYFRGPDVSYCEEDEQQRIVVCGQAGKATAAGTSFAAPWISRKMAYLIHIMGLSREAAKALIIDSAVGWKREDDRLQDIGYGAVPKRIEEILYSADDEIRFIMTGTMDEDGTHTYRIPLPQSMNAYPYFARATLAYFPESGCSQGIDYMGTEMDVYFGRMIEKDGKAAIKSINGEKQAEGGASAVHGEACRMYWKWGSIKQISERVREGAEPRKAYESGLWGLSIKAGGRAQSAGRRLRFGVVVTLKEMKGVNRIDEFVKLCMVRGWGVNRLDLHKQWEIYRKAEEEIEFES